MVTFHESDRVSIFFHDTGCRPILGVLTHNHPVSKIQPRNRISTDNGSVGVRDEIRFRARVFLHSVFPIYSELLFKIGQEFNKEDK